MLSCLFSEPSPDLFATITPAECGCNSVCQRLACLFLFFFRVPGFVENAMEMIVFKAA